MQAPMPGGETHRHVSPPGRAGPIRDRNAATGRGDAVGHRDGAGDPRFFEAAGYLKLSGGGLHIAHLLWGGLPMLVGLGAALALVGRTAQLSAAVLGGAGFGLFIDEVGKFVTERTDYPYRPAAGIIYRAFATLPVLMARLDHRGHDSADRRTARAVQLALTGVTSALTPRRHAAALRLAEDSDREADIAATRLLTAVQPRHSRGERRSRSAADVLRALVTPGAMGPAGQGERRECRRVARRRRRSA
ncbi:hypothetical protein OG992_31615 [Micromonospora sp. NBC_00362]|uniref:hypothetical protein n=1 Tax=Micromonospora sp. NBC_00362 TaxID=2975975 RepID=UPI00224F8787|nr:hypothetical protein [Micromonospora sp. NBC_00362]MCX5121731.1 hypothetical protein [Micromonospora sp. NBC_00362]